jgi:endonuclease YncB( thermonuclease family)
MKPRTLIALTTGFLIATTATQAQQAATYNIRNLTFKRPFVIDKSKLRIVDGDTWQYRDETYRAIGYDTPEVVGCAKALGTKATNELRLRVEQSPKVRMQRAVQRDKYGRRLAKLYVTIFGNQTETGQWLIDRQLAHSYDGSGKRTPWPCG